MHLIRIDNIKPHSVPTLDEVRPDVETAWRNEVQRQANQDKLKTLIQKYKVDVEDADEMITAE